MTPLVVIEFATEIVRLINNLLEGTSIEQRKAQALIWFNLTWPVVKPLIPKDQVDAIEAIMAEVRK